MRGIDHLHNMFYADVAKTKNPQDIFKLRAHDVQSWAQNVLLLLYYII